MSYKRHYCYRIDFEDGFVYFGVRTCSCPIAADSYMGSPKTHAAKWLSDTPRIKTVVSVHATRQLANKAEAKLISDFWTVSRQLSLNAAVHGVGFNRSGVTASVESRVRHSKYMLSLGERHPSKRLEFRLALSERNRGSDNPAKKLKNRLAQSERMTGNSNPMKSLAARQAMSERMQSTEAQEMLAIRNKAQATCPNCGKSGQRLNPLRWHFDNCKAILRGRQ